MSMLSMSRLRRVFKLYNRLCNRWTDGVEIRQMWEGGKENETTGDTKGNKGRNMGRRSKKGDKRNIGGEKDIGWEQKEGGRQGGI